MTDRDAVQRLLSICGLPLEGVSEQFDRFVIAAEGPARELVGCAGLEVHGPSCVLRSLAVHPAARGRGIAQALIAEILRRAREEGCKEAFLLTRTIEPMALRHGFERIGREQVPAALLTTTEFELNACVTATVMRRIL